MKDKTLHLKHIWTSKPQTIQNWDGMANEKGEINDTIDVVSETSLDVYAGGCGVNVVVNNNRFHDSTSIIFKSNEEAIAAAEKIFKDKERLRGGFKFMVENYLLLPERFDYTNQKLKNINAMSIDELKEYVLQGKTSLKTKPINNSYYFKESLLDKSIRYIEYPRFIDYVVNEDTKKLEDNQYQVNAWVGNPNFNIPTYNNSFEFERDINDILLENQFFILEAIKKYKLKFFYKINVKFYNLTDGITSMELLFEGAKEKGDKKSLYEYEKAS